MFTDEHIEYWARVYRANPGLRARGLSFAVFIEAPAAILRSAAFAGPAIPHAAPDEYLPLLPAQRAARCRAETLAGLAEVAEALDQALDAVAPHRRNGAAVEPLHHRAWPRSGACTHRVRRAF